MICKGKFFGFHQTDDWQKLPPFIRDVIDYGPGGFWRTNKTFGILLPNNNYREGFLPVIDIFYYPNKRPVDQACWIWNGLDEHATLQQSILGHNSWHGYLTDGNLVSV